MVTHYKLPTNDGEIILVEARQAGQTVRDGQGNPVQVPTLLELKQLEAVAPAEPLTTSWSRVHGTLFVAGALLVLISAWVLYDVYRDWPETAVLADTQIDQPDLSQLDGTQLYRVWKQLETLRLETVAPGDAELDARERIRLTARAGIASAFAVLGLVLIIGAFLLPGSRSTH